MIFCYWIQHTDNGYLLVDAKTNLLIIARVEQWGYEVRGYYPSEHPSKKDVWVSDIMAGKEWAEKIARSNGWTIINDERLKNFL